MDRWTFADILQDEWARVVREYNQCHTPSGADGGQFCSKGGGAATASKGENRRDAAGRHVGKGDGGEPKVGSKPAKPPKWFRD